MLAIRLANPGCPFYSWIGSDIHMILFFLHFSLVTHRQVWTIRNIRQQIKCMLSAVKTFITTAQNNIMIIETNKQTMREREKSEYDKQNN